MLYKPRDRSKSGVKGDLCSWSASRWRHLRTPTQHTNVGDTRDGQGCHHLPPTPQPWHAVISVGSLASGHHIRILRSYSCPPQTPTLRMDELEQEQTQKYYRPLPPPSHHLYSYKTYER